MMTTPIFDQCSGHMLSPQHTCVQLFKSCAGANMIKPIPIHVMLCDLSEWCFLKIVQPPLLSSSPCRLKRKPCLHKGVSNGSILINIHELLTLILLSISKRFYPKSLQLEKKRLVSPVEPAPRISHVEPA